VTVISDPAGDASNGQQFHDITSISMAEPENMTGKLVFTIKVASLSTIPPGWRWAVRFGAPQRPPNAVYGETEDWFVSMVTSDETAGRDFNRKCFLHARTRRGACVSAAAVDRMCGARKQRRRTVAARVTLTLPGGTNFSRRELPRRPK
jgi:hypothetical protein